jgi:tRNA A37 threonylcarbamoyladenosine modification protein TsaB
MYLFLNTIVRPANIFLFSEGKILAREEFDITGHEFDDLLEIIELFLSKNSLTVPTLSGIVAVNGPGGFTSTRIVSLIVNTWRSLYHIPTQSLTLFEMYEKAG